jgi:hypothetical protein
MASRIHGIDLLLLDRVSLKWKGNATDNSQNVPDTYKIYLFRLCCMIVS